jgi:hypothetical protein
MLSQVARHFTEQLKEMRFEMRSELEAMRAELRKNIFELPQETAEGAAQMRRVIVDQVEALAELNRIVARHGRNLDTVEPSARRADPVDATPPRRESILANGSSRAEPARPRGDLGGLGPSMPPAPPPPAPSGRRAESPSLRPAHPRVAR